MRPTLDRFIERYEVDPETGCWNWTGEMARYGYGRLRMEDHRSQQAHRVGYELAVGPIPDGLVIDHLCRNRRCVNPDHLEPVTQRVNTLRGEGITAERANRNHCVNGHEYTPDTTYITKAGHRQCRACKRERERANWPTSRKRLARMTGADR